MPQGGEVITPPGPHVTKRSRVPNGPAISRPYGRRADVTTVLVHVLVVLVAAKLSAEAAERAGVPAVVGEILAGVVIGPSALGLVEGDAVLRSLGELGVILLLLQVGLEMDLAELGAVGRASLAVAVVGIVVPFASGAGVGLAAGMTGNEAVFIGAALTATSVGITARVFGDLRALASVEARTVLGAAVADDVLGLVILTVVVKLVGGDSVSVLGVLGTVGIAAGFLLATSVVGVRLAPPLFARVQRHSRSPGTLLGLAFAFTLGVAELADLAGLAPIVGAFVAGLSLTRSRAAERLRRDLAPVGHLFVPVFFLQIGIEADVGRFADPGVLALAAALLAVALVGKLVSSVVAGGGDRLLIGIGMVPRGEVGLIFAAIGLRQRVFGEDEYAALLLVVLATTLLTPPALRWRLGRLRARAHAARVHRAPAEGWLVVTDHTVELAAEPPLGDALAIALEAAVACETRAPGTDLLAWLASLPPDRLPWDAAARRRFLGLLSEGGPRAWRFLAVTGVLDRSLPELAEALSRRQADAGQIDPLEALRWPTVARLRERGAGPGLQHPERLLLAAVVLDATDGALDPPVVVARRIVQRLELGAGTEQAVAGLVEDAELLPAASRRLDGVAEEPVLALATHLGSPERARAQYLLAVASTDGDVVEHERLATLHELLQAALSHPELTGRAASNAIEQRRARAARLTTDPAVAERIAAAPRAYVLQVEPADLARQAALCEPPPGRRSVRVSVLPEDRSTRIELVAADRVGLLAAETGVLADLGLDVTAAVVATWGDGCALGSFKVTGVPPDPDELRERLVASLDAPLRSDPLPGVRLECDNDASPWHTVCTVEAADRVGLLHGLTTAFAAAGASVHALRLSTAGGVARDVFELTDRSGSKLDESVCDRVAGLVSSGAAGSRVPWRRVRLP